MKRAFLIFLLLLLCTPAWGANRYVSPHGNGSAPTVDPGGPTHGVDGADWSGAYVDLEDATDAMANGDTVILEIATDHTFTNDSGVSGKTVTIRNYNNNTDYTSCVVDVANASYIGMSAGGDATITIKGIWFKDAAYVANPGSFLNAGDTAYKYALTIISCKFSGFDTSGYTTDYAGVFRLKKGVDTDRSTLTLTDCVFTGNKGYIISGSTARSSFYVVNANVVITGLLWDSNGGDGYAGNMWFNSVDDAAGAMTVSISNSIFSNNHTNNNSSGDGGALKIDNGGTYTTNVTATINDCFFENNYANQGGAFYAGHDAISTCNRCKFIGNSTVGQGGAARRGGMLASIIGHSIYNHCAFINNTAGTLGGAVEIIEYKYAIFRNCSFSGNTAGTNGDSLYAEDHNALGTVDKSSVINCSFGGAAANDEIKGFGDDGFDSITYCVLDGTSADIDDAGATVSNITYLDPLFYSSTDLQLRAESPCPNAGIVPFSDGDGNQYDLNNVLIWNDRIDLPVGRWYDGADIGAYAMWKESIGLVKNKSKKDGYRRIGLNRIRRRPQ
jgi:predicted outer membrane repeat protein